MTWPSVLLLLITCRFCLGDFISTCSSNDTDWNSKDVAGEIIRWLESITEIDDESSDDDDSKQFRFFDEHQTMLEFVCSNGTGKEGPRLCWTSAPGEIFEDHPFSHFYNGFVYGNPDEDGRITGMPRDSGIFVYPDMRTVMVGKFVAGVMKAARESSIIAERCRGNIKEIKVRKPKKDSSVLGFQRPTGVRHSGSENVMDPLERRSVYVKDTPYGDGIFAKRDILEGELVLYYGGLIENHTERPIYYDNRTQEESVAIQTNLFALYDGLVVDVPLASVWQYRATLGHKVNHGFVDPSGGYIHVFHPRQGRIVGLKAERDIAKGEEILANYGYNISSSLPFKWFIDGYRREVGELPPETEEWYRERWGDMPEEESEE